MNRYFLEVSYKGTRYAGFQIQTNAITIQSEVEKSLEIIFRQKISLTGSSRTDAGVHALQNYFHLDVEREIDRNVLYNLNSILPADISIRNIRLVPLDSHCRFDAIARKYVYHICQAKTPFLDDRTYYYPYPLDMLRLKEASQVLFDYSDYASFSKRKTQVKTFQCSILESNWTHVDEQVMYTVKANRFLRGMVRGLVGTMLLIARHKLEINQFKKIIEEKNPSLADFSAPARGLFLNQVIFPDNYFGD